MNPLYKNGVDICDQKFVVKVSKDKLMGFVTIKDPKSGVAFSDVEYSVIKEESNRAGVNFGLLDQPVLIKEGAYCIAKGVAAIHGENAKIKSFVKPAVVRTPKINNSKQDKVDFRELGTIVNVPKGKLLLEKIPLTNGSPGKKVTSDIINAKAGKDVTIKVGPGVTLSEDGMQVVSDVEGKYVLADGKAAVMVEHTVLGDIDMSIGNIAFVGQKLTVNGAVLPGFKVKCKKDVYISQGVQNSAEVTAGGNLLIKGGVIGEDVVLQSWGDTSVDFVENVGRIEVKNNFNVTDSIIQGHAKVGGTFKALAGKGTVIGGTLIVGGSAHIKELGSDAEVVTAISVGINPELEEKKRKLEEDKQVWPEKMNEILKTTSAIKKQQKEAGGKLPPEKVELMKKLNGMLPQVMEKVNKLTEIEQVLEEEIEKTINESVYVYGQVYPGTTVTICGISRTLVSEENWVVIHFDKSSRQIHCRSMSLEERHMGGKV